MSIAGLSARVTISGIGVSRASAENYPLVIQQHMIVFAQDQSDRVG
jgi:hypothetical protein